MALRKLPTFTKKSSSSSVDFNDPETRAALLEQFGVEPPKPQANVLQRLTSALSAFETGNAVFKGLETGDVGEGISQYISDIFRGLGGAISGDVDTEKKTFSDVLGKLGMEKGVPRDILGFVGDVGLDPSTYVTIGTGGGSKVGGKTLTAAGKNIYKEGTELAGRRILEHIGVKTIGEATEEGIVMGLKKFAKEAGEMGIKDLNVLNKGAREVALEFGERRVMKFMDKTGVRLTKEGAEELGIKAGTELAKESAVRFAGKKLFTLNDGMAKIGLRSYFDPLSTAGELIGKTPIGQTAKRFVADAVYPIRKLFSRTAEISATAGMERQYKFLLEDIIKFANKSRYAGSQLEKVAKDAADQLLELKTAPDAFGFIFENTPKEFIDKLPAELQQKIITVMSEVKKLSQQVTESGDTMAQAVKKQIAELPVDKDLTVTEKLLQYKDNFFKSAEPYPDPVDTFKKGLLAEDENIGGFVDFVTQKQLLYDEKTDILKKAGLLVESPKGANTLADIGTFKNVPTKKGEKKVFSRTLSDVQIRKLADYKDINSLEDLVEYASQPGFKKMKTDIVEAVKERVEKVSRMEVGKDPRVKKIVEKFNAKLNNPKIQEIIEDYKSLSPLERTMPEMQNIVKGYEKIQDYVSDFNIKKSGLIDNIIEKEGVTKITEKVKVPTTVPSELDSVAKLLKISPSKFENIIKKVKKANKEFQDVKGLKGVTPSYLGRIVLQTPTGKITEFTDKAAKVAMGKGSLSPRHYKYLAELISAGGITTTSDKIGKEAAIAIGDIFGKTTVLHTKASAYLDLQRKSLDSVDSLGNKVFQAAEEVGDEVIRTGSFKQVKSSINGKVMFDGKYAPREIADVLEKVHKTFFTEEGAHEFLTIFDKLQGFFKKSVTQFFPAFHIRNFTSNVWANATAGVKNIAVYNHARELQHYGNTIMQKGIDSKEVVKLGKKMVGDTGFTMKELMSVAEKNGVIGAGTFWDEIVETGYKGEKNWLHKLANAPSDMGNFIEDNAKLAHFVDKIQKGNSIEEAALSVKKYLFDYGSLTDFEKNTLRRVIPFYCVSTDTEILTQKGWKSYKQLTVGENVMTLEHDKGELEWQPLEEVAVFDFDGYLENLKQGKYDLLYTEDHRWAVINYKGERKIIRANEFNTGYKIPLTGNYKNKKEYMGERLAAIIGWAVTDGYMRERGNHLEVVLYQTPKKHLTEILELVGDEGTAGKPHPDSGTVPVYLRASLTKQIKKHLTQKDQIENVVGRLPYKEALVMWEAMFKAEGTTREDKSYKFFAQKYYPGVRNAFQILTLMVGKTANLGKRGCYIKSNKNIKIANVDILRVPYKGKIWCPKTKNSTWIMRRNGAMIPTGNTWTRKNAELQLREIASQPGKYSTILKGFRDVQDAFTDMDEEDIKKLPPWVRNGVQIITGENGEANVIQGFGTPLEAFSSFAGGFLPDVTGDPSILSSMSPMLKFPIETMMDKNIFTGKQLSKDISAKQFQGFMSGMPQKIKDLVGYQEIERTTRTGEKYIEYIIHPTAKYTINLLLGRLASTAGRIGTIDQGGNLADVLSGLKTYNFNLAEEEGRREKELTEALFDELQRRGLAKEFTTKFLTKETKEDL